MMIFQYVKGYCESKSIQYVCPISGILLMLFEPFKKRNNSAFSDTILKSLLANSYYFPFNLSQIDIYPK